MIKAYKQWSTHLPDYTVSPQDVIVKTSNKKTDEVSNKH
jgi:hypothetical protein